MASTNTARKQSYTCSGTGPYPITFEVELDASGNAENIKAQVLKADGSIADLIVPDGITISGLNVWTVDSYDNTNTLMIYRETPQTQPLSYEENGPFSARSLEERGLDRIVHMIQEVNESVSRLAVIPISDPTGELTITTWAKTLLDDIDAAAARTTLDVYSKAAIGSGFAPAASAATPNALVKRDANGAAAFGGTSTFAGIGFSGGNLRMSGLGTSQVEGAFDTGTTKPSHTTRLNYDGTFHATQLRAVGGAAGPVAAFASAYSGSSYFRQLYLYNVNDPSGGMNIGAINALDGLVEQGGYYASAGNHYAQAASIAAIEMASGDIVFKGAAGLTIGTINPLSTYVTIKGGTGNVGIGQTSPRSLLELRGGQRYMSNSSVAHGMTGIAPTDIYYIEQLFQSGSPVVNGGPQFWGLSSDIDTPAMRWTAVLQNDTTASGYAGFVFRGGKAIGTSWQAIGATGKLMTVNNYTTNDLFTILGNGNVGIGTPSPTNVLSIGNDLGNLAGNKVAIGQSSGSPGVSFGYDGTHRGYLVYSVSDNRISLGGNFGNGTNDVINIISSGNVGIGATSPAHALEVNGTGAFSGAVSLGSTLGVTGLLTASAGVAVPTGKYFSGGAKATSYGTELYSVTSGDLFAALDSHVPNVGDKIVISGVGANDIDGTNWSFAVFTFAERTGATTIDIHGARVNTTGSLGHVQNYIITTTNGSALSLFDYFSLAL